MAGGALWRPWKREAGLCRARDEGARETPETWTLVVGGTKGKVLRKFFRLGFWGRGGRRKGARVPGPTGAAAERGLQACAHLGQLMRKPRACSTSCATPGEVFTLSPVFRFCKLKITSLSWEWEHDADTP